MNLLLKLIIACIILFFSISFQSYADGENITRKDNNDMAIFFSLFDIENQSFNFKNKGIGFQIYFTDNLAFRNIIGFNSSSNDNSNELDFYFSPGVRYSFANNKNVVGYFGTDLIIDYAISELNYSSIQYESNTLFIAFTLNLGAELFIYNNFSLNPEYKLIYGRENMKSKMNTNIGSNYNTVLFNTQLMLNFLLYIN